MNKADVPNMAAPGYPIKPFLPPYQWLDPTLEKFYARPNYQCFDEGRYSFSDELIGIYRIPMHEVNYGLSAGALLRSTAKDMGWKLVEEVIDGVKVVTCHFDRLYLSEKEISVQNTMCRAVCIEPWAIIPDGERRFGPGFAEYNFFYLWLGKKEMVKAVSDQKNARWLS